MEVASPIGTLPEALRYRLDESRDQIRLLTVLPTTSDQDDTVHCKFIIASLDHDIEYETLSYAWGDLSATNTIKVEGYQVEVTRNLYSALQFLRRRASETPIWIDALCINQSNTDEKTSQVNMMGRIYRQSLNCVVWLGAYDEGDEPFTDAEVDWMFDTIKMLAGEMNVEEVPHWLESATIRSRMIKALTAMTHAPWWGRIWTVQEAVLPKHASLTWGKNSIPWTTVAKAADDLCFGIDPSLPSDVLNHLWAIVNAVPAFCAGVRGLTIVRDHIDTMLTIDLYYRFRYRHATDPRDKVYGLCGLRNQKPSPSVSSCDYSLDVPTLYTRVTKDLITAQQDLLPLVGRRGEPHRVFGLPSWVVDWTKVDDSKMQTSRYWTHRFKYFNFDAAKGLGASFSFSKDDSVFQLDGICIDKVSAVGSSLPEENEGNPPSHQSLIANIRLWEQLVQNYTHRYPDKSDIPGRPLQQACLGVVLGAFDEAQLEHKQARYDLTNGYPDLYSASLAEGDDSDKTWINEMTKIQRLLIGDDGYVGLGPPNVQVGDEVWVLGGGNVPMILRPRTDKTDEPLGIEKRDEYEFVGDAWVFGVMFGEVVHARKNAQRRINLY